MADDWGIGAFIKALYWTVGILAATVVILLGIIVGMVVSQ